MIKLKKISAANYEIDGHPDFKICGFNFGGGYYGWDLFYKGNVHPSFGTYDSLKEIKKELSTKTINDLYELYKGY